MNKEIKIYKRGSVSDVRCVAPICQGSVFKFMLMSEDSLTIKFSTNNQIGFQYGDYIKTSELTSIGVDSMLSDRYVILDANNPTYNESTGSYTYTLKFKAKYMQLNNNIFMLPYTGLSGTLYRREISWSITDYIEAHVRLWLINAKLLGHVYNCRISMSNHEWINLYHQDGDVKISYRTNDNVINYHYYFTNSSKYIEYEGKKMIDALNEIASAWECEWHFSGNTLYIDRAENFDSTPYEVSNYTNSTIKSSGSEGGITTRLYAYGSSKNIVSTYRKRLVFSVKSGRTNPLEITDSMRPMNVSMFKNRVNSTLVSLSGTISGRRNFDLVANNFNSVTLSSESVEGNAIIKDFSGLKVCLDSIDKTLLVEERRSYDEYMVKFNNSVKLIVHPGFTDGESAENQDKYLKSAKYYAEVECVAHDYNGNAKTLDKKTVEFAQIGNYKYMYYDGRMIYAVGISADIEEYLNVDYSNADFQSISLVVHAPYAKYKNGSNERRFDNLKFDIKSYYSFKVESRYNKATFQVRLSNGNLYNAVINPDLLNYSNTESSRMYLVEGQNVVLNDGDSYEIGDDVYNEIYVGKVPSAYYSEPEEVDVKNAVAETRLRIPQYDDDGNPMEGYVDLEDEDGNPIITNANDIIEGVKYFDDIYPQREDSITSIKTIEYEKTNGYDVSGDVIKEKFNAYMFKAQYASLDFSDDFIIKDGDGLHITFSTGNLAGMTFEVNWNPTHEGEAYQSEKLSDGTRNPNACWFEIIANNDYGRLLPDARLYPANGDKFTMYGYDASYISVDLIYDAEDDLLVRAKSELIKQLHSDRTYTIALLPSYAKENMFLLGDLVKITTPNYILPERTERVLGCEVCVDIPEDNPKFIVGEKSIYSRIKSIEGRIKKN